MKQADVHVMRGRYLSLMEGLTKHLECGRGVHVSCV